MAYVVTQACIDNKHTNCVDVCPVEAFREGPDMLYIDPQACIECNACLTECPERAIYPESAVPEHMAHFIALNAEKAKVAPVIKQSINKEEAGLHSPLQGRFAVVGSGPSGFYSVEALLKAMPAARVDIFEQLPTPFGLVRYGVAPDHPRIKSVTHSFERLAQSDQVRFFGNVTIGRDISTEELKQHYHAIIYATGGSKSRSLNLPGAQLGNLFGASDFVGWYNGHPHHQQLAPKFEHERAAIIGMGNVALDIARILCLPETTLRHTDMADSALTALKNSKIKEVCLLARRGPVQSAFTPKELEQLMAIPDLNLIVDAADLELDSITEAELALPQFSEARQNRDLLNTIAKRPHNPAPHCKTIRFVFCASPTKIEINGNGKTLHYCRNTLQRDAKGRVVANPTDQHHNLDFDLLINATGYMGNPIEGLPFDEAKGVISHSQSRIDQAESNHPQYVAGWIKRGASGVIGSNKQCASETVTQLMSDLPDSLEPPTSDITELLEQRAVAFIDFQQWQLLDQHEQAKGKQQGRPRFKETQITHMLDIIRKAEKQKAEEDATQASLPIKTHYRSCTLCEAMCGIKIEYQGRKILSISGDEDDSHSEGHICPKGYALQDLHNDPDRLKRPLKKVQGQWVETTWEDAFAITAQNLVSIQEKWGNDAVGAYWGNPTSHNLGLMLSTGGLRKALGTRNLFSAASLDQMPHQLTSYLMFGLTNAFTIPDIDHTDYLLMLGANPAASNGSLMTSGDVLKRLESIKHRGGKFILIDPRENETALYATEHHFIRPATDALFLIGIIHTIIENQWCKPGRLKNMIDHYDDLLGLFNVFPLDNIANLCGISESNITRIAQEFSAAPSAICYGRMGVATQRFGALNHWLMNVLNIITGNLDRRGGMMFTTPAMDAALKPNTAGSFAQYHSRVRGLPEVNREFPASILAEEMLTPGEGQIRGFICMAGNPALSTPNANQLEKALSELDFMVSVDFYLNETSRHADIILPPTGPLEHEQFDLVFNLLAVHNVAKFSEPLFDHEEGTLSDWDIMHGLIAEISQRKGKEYKGPQATPSQIVDYSLQTGPYGKGFTEYRPNGEAVDHSEGLSLKVLKQFEHGLDLGPLQARLPDHLNTPNQKIQIMPEPMVNDLQRLQQHANTLLESKSLLLIGRRDLRTNNSWMHNSERLVKGKDRCALLMHPKDAQQHNVQHAQKAKIQSRVGALTVTINVTESIMPGVVCLPHGWGHDQDGIALRVAQTNPGINKNTLTDDQFVDGLSGNAIFNGVPVMISAV